MLKIKIPFGFKTLSLDSLFVFYTGKIRVKADCYVIREMLQHVDGLVITEGRRNCTIITYVVTDYSLHTRNIKEINNVLKNLMIDRIEKKYADFSYNPMLEVNDELPF